VGVVAGGGAEKLPQDKRKPNTEQEGWREGKIVVGRRERR